MVNLTPLGNNTYLLQGMRRDSVTNRFKTTTNLTAAETAATAIIRQLPPETVERLNEWLDNALAGHD